jgi:hypothetical protein
LKVAGSGRNRGKRRCAREQQKGALGVQNGGSFTRAFRIGEGPEYRPFRDLRSLPEAGRPREQVESRGRACTQVLFLLKAELGFFHFLEIVTGWLKTGFFRQVRELKIQRENPGRALRTIYWAYRHCKVPVRVSA